MAERTVPPKKDVARALLLRGSVLIHLDPRRAGVRVPPWLAKQPQLALCIGLDLPVPIPDLRVDDAGVSGTLSFNRSPYLCVVPWSAVFALVGDDGVTMVWPEDIPAELAAQLAPPEHDGDPAAATELDAVSELVEPARPPEPAERRPRLRAIAGGAAGSDLSAPRDDDPSRARPPYLRRVK